MVSDMFFQRNRTKPDVVDLSAMSIMFDIINLSFLFATLLTKKGKEDFYSLLSQAA